MGIKFIATFKKQVKFGLKITIFLSEKEKYARLFEITARIVAFFKNI